MENLKFLQNFNVDDEETELDKISSKTTSRTSSINSIATTKTGLPSTSLNLAREDSFKNHSHRLAMVWKSDYGHSEGSEINGLIKENNVRWCQIGRYPLLIPLMVIIAFLNILSYGIISALAGQSIPPNNFDSAFVIAGYFLLYSITSAIFSISWGYIYDFLGWIFLLSVVQILLLSELIFIAINMNINSNIASNPILSQYYVWWIIGLSAGIVDTGCNVLLNASISFTFDKQIAPYVFSWYRFIYCFSCATFSIMNYYVDPLYIMYVIIGWSLFTSLTVILFKTK